MEKQLQPHNSPKLSFFRRNTPQRCLAAKQGILMDLQDPYLRGTPNNIFHQHHHLKKCC